MHSDLSPHLHTVECNIVISKLKECHADNTFLKFLGVCSDIDRELVKCLKKEVVLDSRVTYTARIFFFCIIVADFFGYFIVPVYTGSGKREAKRKKNAEEGKRKREAMRLRMSTASSE